MVSICGYSFMRDVNSCDQFALPTRIEHIDIKNAAYNFIDVKPNIDTTFLFANAEYDSGVTIVNSDFNHTIFKNFINVDTQDVGKIVVSRYSRYDDDWAVIGEYILSDSNDEQANIEVLKKILQDNSVTTSVYIYKIEYYKWVNGSLILDENMTIMREMEVQLSANFLSDDTEVFPLYMDMQLTATRNQQVSQMSPLARKYPIIIRNAMTDYHSGNIGGSVMNDFVINELQHGKGYTVEAQEQIKLLKNRITKFLTNGKTKMFRTVSGDAWVIQVTGNVQVDFNIIGGRYMCNFSFDYVEVDSGQTVSGIERVN